jgi:hypothetical protein
MKIFIICAVHSGTFGAPKVLIGSIGEGDDPRGPCHFRFPGLPWRHGRVCEKPVPFHEQGLLSEPTDNKRVDAEKFNIFNRLRYFYYPRFWIINKRTAKNALISIGYENVYYPRLRSFDLVLIACT